VGWWCVSDLISSRYQAKANERRPTCPGVDKFIFSQIGLVNAALFFKLSPATNKSESIRKKGYTNHKKLKI